MAEAESAADAQECRARQKRAPRPTTVRFDSSLLADKLEKLAILKTPGFSWDGSSYDTSGRGAAPNIESLNVHVAPLSEMLSVARTGFPSHPSLSGTLTALHWKHRIWEGIEVCKVHRVD